MMNERIAHLETNFEHILWNGLIYNSLIEWVKSNTDESVDSAVERVKSALGTMAESIGKDTIG